MWCKIQALEEMAKTNQGKITCPRTNEVCNFSDLARAYISWCLLEITSFCVFLGSSNQELTALQTSQHGVKFLPLVSQGYLQSPCNQQFDHWCEYSFSFSALLMNKFQINAGVYSIARNLVRVALCNVQFSSESHDQFMGKGWWWLFTF